MNTRETLLISAAMATMPFRSISGAQSAAPAAAFAKGPHTGTVNVAVVGITTRFLDGHSTVLEERHGTGMMLRCDGFVLFSAAMLDHRADEPEDIRPAIEVTVEPGSPGERRVKAVWPKAIPSNLSLRLVKLDGTHTPALRTLLPDTLKPGDPLMIAWLPWDESAHRFGPMQRRMVHFALHAALPRTPWLAALDEPAEGVSPGAIVVGPEGMAVGMATGRTGEDRRQFVTMEALGKVTNCVAPVPTTDVEFAARSRNNAADSSDDASAPAQTAPPDAAPGNPPLNGTAAGSPGGTESGRQSGTADAAQRGIPLVPNGSTVGAPQAGAAAGPPLGAGESDAANPDAGGARRAGGMVKVPGGPVVLPRAILDSELEMERSPVACIPSFEIDRYEVSNQDYWDFWSRLPNKTSADQALRRVSWPAGWADGPMPFPPELTRVPVLGVSLVGAQAYARAQGKRLPTPYEWTLAALGPAGDARAPDWLAAFIAERNDVALHIKKAHIAFLQEYPQIHGEDFLFQTTRLHNLTLTKVKVGRSWLTVNADQRIHGSDFMPGLPWIISPLLGFAPEIQGAGGFFDALNDVEGFDMPTRLKMQKWSKATIEAETQGLWDKWKAPSYILAVGSRAFDISPFGASDMLWNGAELVLPPATAPSGLNGFAVSVTMMHPQEKPILNDMLLVSGPNASGLVEEYSSPVVYPLSRLIERSPGFPVAQWLWFQNNVEETRAAMRVVSGWQVNLQPASATVSLRTDNHSPFIGPVFYDNYPLYREWARPSRHTRTEIGSAIPLPTEERLPTPLVPRDTGATLRFLVPIGFRCAR